MIAHFSGQGTYGYRLPYCMAANKKTNTTSDAAFTKGRVELHKTSSIGPTQFALDDAFYGESIKGFHNVTQPQTIAHYLQNPSLIDNIYVILSMNP